MLSELIGYLNRNSGALMVVFSGVVTISTVAYALLTWKLVSETRKMRQVQTEPRIEIVLKSLDFAINIARLHVRNIGLGPAINVNFVPRIVTGGDEAKALLEEFTRTNFFKVGLKYLGPGQELHSGYTQMSHNTEAKIESVFVFDLEYQGATGKKYKDHITIDISEHKGAYQLGTPNLYSIAQSLKKIQEEFSHVISGFKKINADIYTTEDRMKEDEERLAAIDRLKNERENS